MLPFTYDMPVSMMLQCALYYDSQEFILSCKELPLPEQWMQSINSITYGQRIDLSELNEQNFITLPLQILHQIEDVSELKACEVIRFSFMVAEGMAELNERDAKYLKYEPTKQEIKAGIKKINHGIFGTIDTIARRCPQYTHDQILELSQAVVFQMLKIDIDNANYAKRLREVYAEK